MRKADEYDRRAILEDARQAQTRGRFRLAISRYREVLKVEPDNPDLHAKVAPLLLANGDERGAWESYIYAGRSYLQEGFDQKALSLFRQAARQFPTSAKIWEAIADIYTSRGHRIEAVNALYEGAEHFPPRLVELSVRLLSRAFKLAPYRLDVTLALARALKTSGRVPQARRLMQELKERDPDLRKIAWAEFWMFPSWRAFSAWLFAKPAEPALR